MYRREKIIIKLCEIKLIEITVDNKMTIRITTLKYFKCLGTLWFFIWAWEETLKSGMTDHV